LVVAGELNVVEVKQDSLFVNGKSVAKLSLFPSSIHLGRSDGKLAIILIGKKDDIICYELNGEAVNQIWTREESLAKAVQVEVLDLPESFVFSDSREEIDKEEHERNILSRYMMRLKNHWKVLFEFFKPATTEISGHLIKDNHGFRKLLIFRTSLKIICLDSNDGRVVWTIPNLDYFDMKITNPSLYYPPVLSFVSAKTIRSVNAITGETIRDKAIKVPNKKQIVLHNQEDFNMILIDDNLNIYHSERIVSQDVHFYVQEKGSVEGYLVPKGQSSAVQIWKFSVPSGQELIGVQRICSGDVASYGKVLQNRTVLYKYLNPNLISVTAQSKRNVFVYLIDSVNGFIVYSTFILDGSLPVHATLYENTLTVDYFSVANHRTEILTVELFESTNADIRNTK
jgi:hypothetical protein